jgi:CRISPR-associated endonuclease/helicase Cas3
MDGADLPLAHVRFGSDSCWYRHSLAEHLKAVAQLSGFFASGFGARDWAALAGQWHDLGKYRDRFQHYIRVASGLDRETAHIESRPGRTTHSTAGALLAEERLGRAGRVLSYVIAGHHAGLPDWNAGLDARLASEDARNELAEACAAGPPAEIMQAELPQADLRLVPGGSAGFALWVRMLFSCLVDADFLDTEAFMAPEQAERRSGWPNLEALADRFDAAMSQVLAEAEPTPVNRLRREILQDCRNAALQPPGVFSLTVPTGGGKTLSSMAFALDHARRHGKRRIIHVIPYTSIIEQTADVFRGIFGEAVVEHHSAAESDPTREGLRSRLACENWDAPLIVTTSVQFFESLFAARTSRCRKLHNLVDSVVVLDEVQLLPPGLLQPIVDVLKQLTEHYGMTLVLSTGTQPALGHRRYFDAAKSFEGFDRIREIIPDPDRLYASLKRVEVRVPKDMQRPIEWESLAAELSEHDSVLVVVNSRRHARELHSLMPPGTLHLSALMCGAHRSRVIAEIKQRLADGMPTRVVSTQLVEAGVDLDFPVVYRALAGLDSIAQAAGRCNREGRLERGQVIVFVPPERSGIGLLRAAENACCETLHGIDGDPLDRALFARYFEHLYYSRDPDENGIRDLLKVDQCSLGVQFRTAAERFRMIEDDQLPIVTLYDAEHEDAEVRTLLGRLRNNGPERWLMRKLQRYIVNVREPEVQRLLAQQDIEEVLPGLFAQTSDWLYHPTLGLTIDKPTPTATQSII